MDPSLRNRLTFGPIMLAALFGLLWLDHAVEVWTRDWAIRTFEGMRHGIGGVGVVLGLSIVLPLAVRELARLFTAENVRPYRFIASLACTFLVLHAFLTQFPKFKLIAASSLAFIIVFVMLFAALRRSLSRQPADAIVHMAGTVLATLYLGGLGWFLVAIRVKQSAFFEGQTMKVVLVLLVVKFTDIGAYFGGRALGRHKLIPWLSPGKTWEGLIIGMLTAGCVGMALAPFIKPGPSAPSEADGLLWYQGLILGIVLGGIGQLGDLLESMMKRDAGVKDSGGLIPGFGGILDVIDSPLLAAPFAYLLFSII
jgi:phosphatidate cytidylyltransferase